LDDQFDQPHEAFVSDVARDHPQQNGVIDIWKKLYDIGLQVEWIAAKVHLSTIHRSVRPFPSSACVAVEDESTFEQGFQNPDNRMMNDAISKWRCADFSVFGLEDVEVLVRTGSVTAVLQFTLQLQ
jgi:hypothetical protein